MFCQILTCNLNAQVVIDWAKAHGDDRIDYIGWDGEMWRATITADKQFRTYKVGNHEDVIINYINYDGSHWTARLNGDKFVHAPEGDWSRGHEDTRMDYLANDNSQCSVTINGNDFYIVNHSKRQSFTSSNLYYLTWDGSVWTAQLSKPKFIHWQGIAKNTTQFIPILKYITWNGTKWTASITSDGLFKHTDERGALHFDKTIIYLNYDASIWGAQINGQRFNHAPGFIPKDKSIWDKVLEGFKKIDIKGGFPEGHPSVSQETTFKGIIVNEENGILYYRPVTDQGICTNDLVAHPTSNIVYRAKVSSCRNLGQNRDIWLFRYKK
jgi:hypothetical protein